MKQYGKNPNVQIFVLTK